MNNVFDSDDSDEEVGKPNNQLDQPSSATNEESTKVDVPKPTGAATESNAHLFGSDSDDSDEDEKPVATTNTDNPVSEEQEAAKPNATDEDSDADVEFNADDDITGKRAPVRHDAHQQSASPIAKTSRVTVPDMPLAQFQDKNVNLHMAQLPKIVGIQPEAFSRDTFNSSLEDEEFRGGVHTMIRWRYKTDEDGNSIRDANDKLVKESNAKIIKWSDGSYGLRVGNDLFDMDEFTYQLHKPPAGVRGKMAQAALESAAAKRKGPSSKDFLYLTQKAQAVHDDGETKPLGTVLECVASIQSKFIPRPASLKSAAHKNFVLKERSRVIKRKQIQEFVTFVDPEKQKAERIRNKDDLMKQEKRRSDGGGKRRSGSGMNRAYMDENDEDYDTVNIRNLKKRNMNDDDMDYGDDYGDDAEADVWSKRKKKDFEVGRRIGQQDYESDEDEDLVVDDEDDEEMVSRKKKSATPQKGRASMFESDSD